MDGSIDRWRGRDACSSSLSDKELIQDLLMIFDSAVCITNDPIVQISMFWVVEKLSTPWTPYSNARVLHTLGHKRGAKSLLWRMPSIGLPIRCWKIRGPPCFRLSSGWFRKTCKIWGCFQRASTIWSDPHICWSSSMAIVTFRHSFDLE